jgi:hypothetical protein
MMTSIHFQNSLGNNLMDIAKTIINQLQNLDKWALPAYASTNFVALEETDKREGGIQFNVSGYHFKGLVIIELTWLDEYRIAFIKDGTTIKLADHVYWDQLIQVLDFIEEGEK